MTTITRLSPKDVLDVLGRHILVDGYHVVMDMEKSRGSYLYDARSERPLLDFFTNFATCPIGYNHPKMADPEFREKLFDAALTKRDMQRIVGACNALGGLLQPAF